MKKILICLLTSVLFLSYSCVEKQNSEQNSFTLQRGETKQLHIPADNNGIWKSSDDFVATVSSTGLVKANHIGNVFITGSDNPVMIEVEAKYNLCKEPSKNWGVSKSKIISTYGYPDVEKDGQLYYFNSTNKILGYVYMFENDKLIASAVVVDGIYSTELTNFLLERYLPIYVDDETSSVMYIDAMTIEECHTVVMKSFVDQLGYSVEYIDKTYLEVKGNPALYRPANLFNYNTVKENIK